MQYEELTPEKSKERLAKLVPKMDLNSDGQVDELELREHINFMQKRGAAEGWRARLARLQEADYNSDGKMDRKEYGCFMHPEDCDHMRDTVVQSGKETDPKHDHEQFLGKDESMQYEELTPEKGKERLAKLVPKMDQNSDGQVDELELQEHINFMQKR
ncbi:hypothetical protein niasHS_004795 [Heterodera schachtii]|uniref:EF-hand domain-containing protein n=1 Tax=Heterodera schachtii TaxID=97005 RepID=A0ABD2JZW3_HETSC